MNRTKIDNAQNGVRSNQNLSCNWTGTADFGRLVPIHWEEMLQTDRVVRFRPRIEMQMLPLASPTFSKIDLYVHGFFVPLRQLQDHFYDIWSRTGAYKDCFLQYFTVKEFHKCYNQYLSGNTAHLRSAAYKHWTSMGLNPFFALPYDSPLLDETPIWLAPFFAYNKIWWDFYRDPELLRDENASDWLCTEDVNGVSPQGWQSSFPVHFLMPHVRTIKNNWLSDLFASGGYDANFDGNHFNIYSVFDWDSPIPYPNANDETINLIPNEPSSPSTGIYDGDNGFVQPTEVSQLSVRLAESLMRLSERLSLSGKRQIEQLFARYGIKPAWSKMNLARYVGGAKSSVLVSEIIANSDTVNSDGTGLPLGSKAGNGYCALDNLTFEFVVDEPGIFMCIASVMPHIHFVQGLSKKWQRKDLQSMFQDSLQYVGNVAIARREVGFNYPQMSYINQNDDDVYAYADPYYEYKMGLDILAGDFMKYHNVSVEGLQPAEEYQLSYMQSMENYIDYPQNRNFDYTNMMVDGDQFNKIFSYLGGSLWEGGDDHFHICVDKEFIVNRPMEGFAIPTIETTKNPHAKTEVLSQDKIL